MIKFSKDGGCIRVSVWKSTGHQLKVVGNFYQFPMTLVKTESIVVDKFIKIDQNSITFEVKGKMVVFSYDMGFNIRVSCGKLSTNVVANSLIIEKTKIKIETILLNIINDFEKGMQNA